MCSLLFAGEDETTMRGFKYLWRSIFDIRFFRYIFHTRSIPICIVYGHISTIRKISRARCVVFVGGGQLLSSVQPGGVPEMHLCMIMMIMSNMSNLRRLLNEFLNFTPEVVVIALSIW